MQKNRSMLRAGAAYLSVFAILLAIASTPAPSAAQTIYRCEQGGRVTYTDSPCSRPLIQPSGAAAAANVGAKQTVVGGGYEKPHGPWRGEAQYQLMNAGLRSEGTHFVVPLMIDIAEEGKFVGASPENNCQMLGIASPGHTPKMLNLDVTLSNCPASDLNQRYHGSLIMDTANRSAQLRLHAQRIGIGTVLMADIKATVRR